MLKKKFFESSFYQSHVMAFGLTFPIVSVIKFICLIKFICFVLRCLNKSLDVLKFTLSIKWIRLFIV